MVLPSAVQIVTDQTQLENLEYFSCFGRVVTIGARCNRKIKFRFATAKATFSEEKNLFTGKL
jgi:hypothetical protein